MGHRMKLILQTMFVFAVLNIPGTALAFGSSNMGYYPAPTCSKPFMKPTLPYSRDSFAISRYNIEVQQYNYAVDRYNDCMRTYITNAKNDVDTIISEVRNIGSGRSSYSFSFGSNFSGLGYPSAQRSCGYSYNQDDLDQCYRDYIRKAKNDIEEIQSKVSYL